jgi:flagellar basal-body rod protein FlgF
MDPIIAVAASGMRSRMESLELLANNVANASTGGYKADREFYSLYLAPEAQESEGAPVMPVIESPWIDFSQGVIRDTGNPLDLALNGKGFFAVNGPHGTLYTRNGNFSVGPDGRLVTPEGYAVRAEGGRALVLQGAHSIEISGDGIVRQEGNVIGKLEIADFSSPAVLVKQGSNYFRAADAGSTSAASRDTVVEQGKLESSNTGSAEAAVRLISVMRQFEMLQKAVALGADMNRRAIEEVAKV